MEVFVFLWVAGVNVTPHMLWPCLLNRSIRPSRGDTSPVCCTMNSGKNWMRNGVKLFLKYENRNAQGLRPELEAEGLRPNIYCSDLLGTTSKQNKINPKLLFLLRLLISFCDTYSYLRTKYYIKYYIMAGIIRNLLSQWNNIGLDIVSKLNQPTRSILARCMSQHVIT